jgi:D-alanyl-D-alanine carboxypeptidase (penicillin-binding protein 5/6)
MNPTGLPNPEHYSSAHDMAVLARAIIHEDPAHYAIYSQKEFFWNGIKQPNRNLLLWRDKTVDGLKTGHTDEAGYCMVSSAVRDGMRLIAVVLGCDAGQRRFDEARAMLDYGFAGYALFSPAKEGDALGANVPVRMGSADQVAAVCGGTHTMLIKKGGQGEITLDVTLEPSVTAPVRRGDVVGEIRIMQGGKAVAKMSAVAGADVPLPGFFAGLLRIRDRFLMRGQSY